jgi:hypothetical protein
MANARARKPNKISMAIPKIGTVLCTNNSRFFTSSKLEMTRRRMLESGLSACAKFSATQLFGVACGLRANLPKNAGCGCKHGDSCD